MNKSQPSTPVSNFENKNRQLTQPAMRISLSNGLVAALSLTPSVNARPNLQPRAVEVGSDWCTLPYTYDDIWHPDPEFGNVNKHATVSDGPLCCDLCYRSNLDCVLAIWDEKTEDCMMYINEKETGEPPRFAWEKEMCPLGISIEGIVSTKVYNWTRNWIGPCWEPADWSNGINIISDLKLPSFFYKYGQDGPFH